MGGEPKRESYDERQARIDRQEEILFLAKICGILVGMPLAWFGILAIAGWAVHA